MGSCCCKQISGTVTTEKTPPSPAPSPPHLLDKVILRKDVSSHEGSTSSKTADTYDNGCTGQNLIPSCTHIVLAEGSPLGLGENSDESARSEALDENDARFSYLWREPAKSSGMGTYLAKEMMTSNSDPRESKGGADVEIAPKRRPGGEDARSAPIYPRALLQGVLEQIEDDGEPHWHPQPFYSPRGAFYNTPACPASPPNTPNTLCKGSLRRITECTNESDFVVGEDFAYDSEECEGQSIKLMKDTARVSSREFAKISKEVAHQRSWIIAETEMNEGRRIQDSFRISARRQKRSNGKPLHVTFKSNVTDDTGHGEISPAVP